MQDDNSSIGNSRCLQLKMEDKSEAPIDAESPWRDDKLDREREAKSLEQLIAEQEGPLTLCLHGSWGTGKTFFLRRFKAQWEASGGKALCFNAWEDDSIEDPLIALIGQLWPLLKQEKLHSLMSDIKKCAWPLIKKIGLSRIGVDEKDITTPGETAFETYVERTASRQHLKEYIASVAKHCADEAANRPLLFIIDELDRCRPTFAVELLERIKHLFPIKHLVFLIGVDREQIKASVRAVYGEIDAENYLHRFFDVTLRLKPYAPSQFIYANYWYGGDRASPSADYFFRVRFEFGKSFCPLIRHFNFSLREVEVAMRIYTLLVSASSTHTDVMLHCLVIALMMKDKSAYSHLIKWDLPIGKLVDAIFGDLLEYEDISKDSSPISFIKYLYRLEIAYDEGAAQQDDIRKLIAIIGNGGEYDINSPLIAGFLRHDREPGIREFFAQIKNHIAYGHFDFRRLFHQIDASLQLIEDVHLL